jgi:hypothetical protein
VSSGVHEGSPLSPLLFIIFIAGLTRHLQEKHDGDGAIRLVDGTRLYCLLYADDVLLVSLSPSGLQKLVDETCRFFADMGLTVNPGKSDIVIFLDRPRETHRLNLESFDIAGLSKESLTEAKYLGVIFQNNGTWQEQMNATLTRCRMARGRCQVICATLGFAKPGPMIQTYDTFVSSVYRYSLGVWGVLAGDLTRIDNLFCDFIRRQYKLPASTCRRSILMQFARRCAACDAKYLATVQLARGLSDNGTIWARVLATTWMAGLSWLTNVRSHLRLLNLEREVLETPASFLGDRRKHERAFSEWCLENHLRNMNGSSTDFFRYDRPFGFYPAIYDVPVPRARSMLTLLLSCWRWSHEGLRDLPKYCWKCDCELNSEHVLFRCVDTAAVRRNFREITEQEFQIGVFRDGRYSKEVADACYQIISIMQTVAS